MYNIQQQSLKNKTNRQEICLSRTLSYVLCRIVIKNMSLPTKT